MIYMLILYLVHKNENICVLFCLRTLVSGTQSTRSWDYCFYREDFFKLWFMDNLQQNHTGSFMKICTSRPSWVRISSNWAWVKLEGLQRSNNNNKVSSSSCEQQSLEKLSEFLKTVKPVNNKGLEFCLLVLRPTFFSLVFILQKD